LLLPRVACCVGPCCRHCRSGHARRTRAGRCRAPGDPTPRHFRAVAERHGLKVQDFVIRQDGACGRCDSCSRSGFCFFLFGLHRMPASCRALVTRAAAPSGRSAPRTSACVRLHAHPSLRLHAHYCFTHFPGHHHLPPLICSHNAHAAAPLTSCFLQAPWTWACRSCPCTASARCAALTTCSTASCSRSTSSQTSGSWTRTLASKRF
jgi:hypothetical protein